MYNFHLTHNILDRLFVAKRTCVANPFLARDMIERMRRRQAIHDGNRSDPYLSSTNRHNVRALDEMKASGLNYSGWQNDFNKAERYCTHQPDIAVEMIEKMKRRQASSTISLALSRDWLFGMPTLGLNLWSRWRITSAPPPS